MQIFERASTKRICDVQGLFPVIVQLCFILAFVEAGNTTRYCNGTVPLWALGKFGSPISLYEMFVDVILAVILVAFLNYQVFFIRVFFI